jgi:hypothetical protein
VPARLHRTGAELRRWEARKARHLERMELARARAMEFSGHTLILLPEAAAMLGGITVKSLREAEARAREHGQYWPPRVCITSRLTGYRLADLEAFINAGMTAPAPEGEG